MKNFVITISAIVCFIACLVCGFLIGESTVKPAEPREVVVRVTEPAPPPKTVTASPEPVPTVTETVYRTAKPKPTVESSTSGDAGYDSMVYCNTTKDWRDIDTESCDDWNWEKTR